MHRYSGAIPKCADSRLASTLTSSVICNGFSVCRCFVLVTFVLHFLKVIAHLHELNLNEAIRVLQLKAPVVL